MNNFCADILHTYRHSQHVYMILPLLLMEIGNYLSEATDYLCYNEFKIHKY
jgi:hypothetical protein